VRRAPVNSGIEGEWARRAGPTCPPVFHKRTRGTLSRLYRLNTPTVAQPTKRGTLSRPDR